MPGLVAYTLFGKPSVPIMAIIHIAKRILIPMIYFFSFFMLLSLVRINQLLPHSWWQSDRHHCQQYLQGSPAQYERVLLH